MAVNLMDPESLLLTFGLVGVLVIIFVETGLLVGFFLPGDSLLFVTGLAAAGVLGGAQLPLVPLLIGAPLCAIAGAQLGHALGAVAGRKLFRSDAQVRRLRKAEEYFHKFGPARAIILARFVGVMRTFINPAAGMLGISARRFLVYNVIGAVLWTDGIILLAFLAGHSLPAGVDVYILPIVLVIMFVSLLPVFGLAVRGFLDRKAREGDLYESVQDSGRVQLSTTGVAQVDRLLQQVIKTDPDQEVRGLAGDLRGLLVRDGNSPTRPPQNVGIEA